MAEQVVNHTWNTFWKRSRNFAPVSFDHDTISIITKQVLSRVRRGGTFVDVGSGPGSRTTPLAAGTTHITLLDQSAEALHLARDYATSYNKSVSLIEADGFAMPFANNTVDAAFSNGLNEHFLEPARQGLFNEMARIVKPEGIVAVIVPNKLNPFHTANKIVREMTGTWPFGPQYDFTPRELKQKMERAGLADVHMHGVGAFTSWIRLFPRERQTKLHKKPTPSRRVNQILWHLDANTSSPINRQFGREIFAIGVKK